MNDELTVDSPPDMSQDGAVSQPDMSQDGAVSQPDMSEGNYGVVSLYRIPQSVQDESEKIPRLSGIGIVPNDFKTQTVIPQFSYQLLRSFMSHGETESQFGATMIGFVILRYRLPQQSESSVPQQGTNSCFSADEFAKAGIRMPSESSHKQCKMSESSAVLHIELEIPLDPLKPSHIAVPKIPLSSKPWMTAEVTGIALPEHVSCSVLTSSSRDWLQIPVTLEKLPPHNPASEYKAIISQRKLFVNPGTQAVQTSETVFDKQSCNLVSSAEPTCVQGTVRQELFGASKSKLNGQVCKPTKTVWDMPHLLVPIFVPFPLDSAEHTSVLSSTTWTLISGSVAVDKYSLMYVPSSVLSSATVSNTHSGLSTNIDKSTLPPTSESDSRHCGEHTGHIYSLGYDNGTVMFTMDGKVEKASFCRSKIYINGFKIGRRSKLRDVLFCQMPVTLNVKQYEGESFSYKATAVYVEIDGEEQLEVCQIEPDSGVGSVTLPSDKSEIKNPSVDQTTTEDEMYCKYVIYLTVDIWDSCLVKYWCVRKHMYSCDCRVCAYEQNLPSTKSCKNLIVETLTVPGKKTSIAESTDSVRQEITGMTHLSEETSNTVSPSTGGGILNSSVMPAVPGDNQRETDVQKLCTEFKSSDTINPSKLVDSVVSQSQKGKKSNNDPNEISTRETKTVHLDHLPKSARNITGVLDTLWSSDAAIMATTIHKVEVRVLVCGRNLYVDGKQCVVTNMGRQHLVEGTLVYADVSKLSSPHPSGAVYFATCAWKGKKPTRRSPRNMTYCEKCGSNAEMCVNCLNKSPVKVGNSRKVNLKLKEDSDAKGCGSMDREKPVHNDVQVSADSAVETEEQNRKNLADEVFVGTVESSGVSQYCGEDKPSTANVDVELQNKTSQHESKSYSAVTSHGVQEQENVEINTQGSSKFPSSKFTVKQREMFYKSRLCYDWGNENEAHKDSEMTDPSDEIKREMLGQAETVDDANVTASLNNKEQIQLPATPTQHAGLARHLKWKLARVKRHESSSVGVLECSISGAEMELIFHRSVVNFCGKNETTDLRDCLPVGTEVYFEGELSGEDWLLGCPYIVVISVWESKTHKKKTTSKPTRFLNLELKYPSMREGLVPGRPYEGNITQIHPPFAFVTTVIEGGKAHDVFVLNKFFSPVEYGTKLPAKHPVVPYIAEGFKVHVLVIRRKEEDSDKYRYEWFAVDAWTEQGDNASPDSRPEATIARKELDTEDRCGYLEGVVVAVYPEWGLLAVDHIKDEVTFFGQNSFLFGIRLGVVDLRQVFRIGKSFPQMSKH
jgi:hypothetical protein